MKVVESISSGPINGAAAAYEYINYLYVYVRLSLSLVKNEKYFGRFHAYAALYYYYYYGFG